MKHKLLFAMFTFWLLWNAGMLAITYPSAHKVSSVAESYGSHYLNYTLGLAKENKPPPLPEPLNSEDLNFIHAVTEELQIFALYAFSDWVGIIISTVGMVVIAFANMVKSSKRH